MSEISPNLKAVIGEVERVAQTLSGTDQDRIAETIRDALNAPLPLPAVMKPLLDAALEDVAAGRVASWNEVKARIGAKLHSSR